MQKTPAILVAQSEPGMRTALVDALLSAGFGATSVADGTLALALCHKQAFDLVVLDLALAGTAAPRVCRELRHGHARLPILFLASRAEDLPPEARAAAADTDWLLMPFGVSEFLARVAALLPGATPTGR